MNYSNDEVFPWNWILAIFVFVGALMLGAWAKHCQMEQQADMVIERLQKQGR